MLMRDWVRARGTTLVADNGLVVAAVMVLEGKTIAHPAGQELCLRLMKTG
jgi:hypothetical protein